MEPIRYFDSMEFIEPRCKGCQNVIHYDKAVFDEKKQVLTCVFCGASV